VWPFKWQPPYEDAIVRIARLGFRAIELIAWDRQALDEYYTPQKIRELRHCIASEGLVLSEFVSTPRGMAHADAKVRDAAVDHFRRLIEVGVGLGAGLVNTVSPYPFDLPFPRITSLPLVQQLHVDIPSDLDWEQNWCDYVDVVRRCVAACEDAGVKYALEPHPYRYMCNAASMLRLIDQVGSPALGMNLDPSHLFPCGEIPQVVVYQLGKRIFHCHFSDNDGVTNVHWRPGKGKIDWREVLVALKAVGFDGVISMELEDVPGVGVAGGHVAAHLAGLTGEAGVAGPAFDTENVLSMAYIQALCNDTGIRVD
jgi:sugar phosphate isomerase/epimerase